MSELVRELVADLNGSPPIAFLELVRRVKQVFSEGHYDPEDLPTLCALLKRFAERSKLGIEIVEKTQTENWYDQLRYIFKVVDDSPLVAAVHENQVDLILDSVFDTLTETEFGFAELSIDEKQKIHFLLNEIRVLIDQSRLQPKKKNALVARLNELSLEVDKKGTRTDRFFGFISELGFALGDFGEKSKPIFDRMKEIIEVVYKNRQKNEGVSLPPRSDLKLLPDFESGEH